MGVARLRSVTNRAEITLPVLTEALPVWVCVGARAIRYSLNIAFEYDKIIYSVCSSLSFRHGSIISGGNFTLGI